MFTILDENQPSSQQLLIQIQVESFSAGELELLLG